MFTTLNNNQGYCVEIFSQVQDFSISKIYILDLNMNQTYTNPQEIVGGVLRGTKIGGSNVQYDQNVTYVQPVTNYALSQPVNYQTTGQTLTGQIVGGQTYYQGGSTLQGGYTTTNQTTYVQSGYKGLSGSQQQGHKVVAQEIPVESRIEYIPFEKKYIEYDEVERVQRVPFERQFIDYEEVTRTERVPIERTITDYYAVETQVEYIPKQIEETIVEYEPVERIFQRVQYLPVQTQIVHYPQRDNYVPAEPRLIPATGGSRVIGGQTTYVSNGSRVVGGGGQTTYVTGTSGVRQGGAYTTGTTYTTGPVVTGGSRVATGNYATTYTTGGGVVTSGSRVGTGTYQTPVTYTSGSVYPTGGYTTGGYTTGGYTTGGYTTTGPVGYTTTTTGGNYVSGGQYVNPGVTYTNTGYGNQTYTYDQNIPNQIVNQIIH